MTPLQDCRLMLIEQRTRNLALQEENQTLRRNIAEDRELHISQIVRLNDLLLRSGTLRMLTEEAPPSLEQLQREAKAVEPKRLVQMWRETFKRAFGK